MSICLASSPLSSPEPPFPLPSFSSVPSQEEKAHYAARDPIPQFKKYMVESGLATEAEIKDIHSKVCVCVCVCVCVREGGKCKGGGLGEEK